MKTVNLKCKQEFYSNGQIRMEEYRLDGKYHNPNGIARKYWYSDGQILSEKYYKHGKRHNPNGIAVKSWYPNGQVYDERYWIDGKQLTKDEFENRNKPKFNPCNGKTIEVDGKKYKLIEINP